MHPEPACRSALRPTLGPMSHAHQLIEARLLHPVTGLSGRTYPEGTEIRVAAADASNIDAFVGGAGSP